MMPVANPSRSRAVTSPKTVSPKPERIIIESAASNRRRPMLQPTHQLRHREISPDIVCLSQILVALRDCLKVNRDKRYYFSTLLAGYCTCRIPCGNTALVLVEGYHRC